LWTVVSSSTSSGKGPAFVRTTLKHVLSGKVVDKTFNAGTKVETATVDASMTYLYADGQDYVFMDGETFDQIPVSGEVVGDGANYCWRTPIVVAPEPRACRCTWSCRRPLSWYSSHRPGSAGRPVHRRHQAGQAGTGAEIRSAVVPQARSEVDTRDGRYLGRVSG